MAWLPSTQVTVGGFSEDVSSQELAKYLETKVGLVERCRVKTSGTPPNAVPIFSSVEAEEHYYRLQHTSFPPHGFVHFVTQDVAMEACKLAERGRLIIKNHALKIRMGCANAHHIQRSSKPPLKLSNVSLELGSLIKFDELLVSWKGPSTGVTFDIDATRKKCSFCLSMETLFRLKDTDDKVWMKCNYKIEFLISDIWSVKKEEEGKVHEGLTMLLQLRVPPWIFYRTADDDIFHATSFLLSDDEDPWIRTLDFTPDKSIGRCLTYRLSVSPRHGAAFQKMVTFFREHQVLESSVYPKVKLPWEVKSEAQRAIFFSVPNVKGLPFEVMFLVNALVHKGIISSGNLTPSFFDLLQPYAMQLDVALAALELMLSYRNPVFDAEKWLKQVTSWIVNKKSYIFKNKVKDGTMMVRRFIITPLKAHCCASQVEVSNRVLREYGMLADRFLRVSFLDDNMGSLSTGMLTVPVAPILREIFPAATKTRTALFKRIKKFLRDGFHLCGRKYSLLAFSANQLRDNSAWFFAESDDLNVVEIREWMGNFKKNNVAKFAARMGQCFSSTYSTVKVPPWEVEYIQDIERNGYIFSDGIGKISDELAIEVARSLRLEHNPPSAYQIRYAGCKGVVARWPSESGFKLLSLRESMEKFVSDHCMLEVVSWTRFLPCFLNRQIITLLSTLKVEGSVFIKLQDAMVDKLCNFLDSPELAIEVLESSCSGDMHSTTLQMLIAGFHPLCEPHLRNMLEAIRAAQMEEILHKARIFVRKGRLLMGTLDELGLLQYGQCFMRVSKPSHEAGYLGNFMGSGNTRADMKVITGKVVVAKNPCLHPGDIRILDAVDMPSLYHLIDCIVMPQSGHRPHPHEASGSDLDGDLYFACWDAQLIPPSGQSWEPMEYVADEINDLGRERRTADLVDFFMKNTVNDNLGVISNAHVVHADLSEKDALDEKCIQLAELAAMAVDFPKTGKPAIMPHDLKPDRYPDFMDKDDKVSYESEKVLGFLFRRVKGKTKENIAEYHRHELHVIDKFSEQFYDVDLEMEGFEEFLTEAWEIKQSYDIQLHALMGQFDVKGEGEIVTGHCITLLKYNSRRQGEMKERIGNAYSALRKKFREIFEVSSFAGESHQDEDKRQKMLEIKASAWYIVTYHPKWLEKATKEFPGDFKVGLLSFPWIAVEFLAKIKARTRRLYESHHALVLSLGSNLDICNKSRD